MQRFPVALHCACTGYCDRSIVETLVTVVSQAVTHQLVHYRSQACMVCKRQMLCKEAVDIVINSDCIPLTPPDHTTLHHVSMIAKAGFGALRGAHWV